jgi:hypothetical protein
MPPGGATFDESTVPPWTRGDFRGVWEGETIPPWRSAPLSRWLDPSPTNTAHQPPPPWPLATGRHPLLD